MMDHKTEASEPETGGSSGDHGSEEAESDSQEAGREASGAFAYQPQPDSRLYSVSVTRHEKPTSKVRQC